MKAWALAVIFGLIVGSPGPVYWDSAGYVAQAITGEVGGLGVGRPVFALLTHALARVWLTAGGSVWDLEPVLRWGCLLVSALAAPATAWFGREVGLSRRAAGLAALVVAASPAMAHASAAVLTDGPTVPAVVAALALAARSTRTGSGRAAVGAGVALGVAIGLREAAATAGLMMVTVMWSGPTGRSRRLLLAVSSAVTVVALPMAWVALTQPGYVQTIRTWLDGMAHDRAIQQWDWRSLLTLAGWLVSVAPLGWALTLRAVPQWPSTPWWRSVVWPAWMVLALMVTYQGAVYSPRYLLFAVPAAVALPAGWWLDRRLPTTASRRWQVSIAAGLVVPVLIAAEVVRRTEAPVVALTSDLTRRLATVPPDAVIVTGHACPVVALIRIQARVEPRAGLDHGRWDTICPGWSWPDRFEDIVTTHVADGRVVVLDLRDDAWRGAEQRRRLTQVQAFAAPSPPGVLRWQ